MVTSWGRWGGARRGGLRLAGARRRYVGKWSCCGRSAGSEDRGDLREADRGLALAAETPICGSTPGAHRAFGGGEHVVVFPHGQRQRVSGLGLEQVVAAAEAGLSGDPGAVAGDVVRIEVRRQVAVFGEAGNHLELLSLDWSSVFVHA